MSTTEKDKTSKTTVVGGFSAAMLAMLLLFFSSSEGVRYTPYYDSVGILTVCRGVTGPAVVKGKKYTEEECHELELAYVQKMALVLEKCITRDLPVHTWLGIGHWAYNIGEHKACSSTAIRQINQGDLTSGCKQITRWRFAGGRDCTIRSNNCFGIVERRQWEMGMCLGTETGSPP